MENSVTKQFIKYVSQNIFGMLGVSCYIIVDTFFIAKAAGANGITVLNLALPMYNLIFAIGSMIGVGSATRFAILRAQKDKRADDYFSNAIFFSWIFGIWFVLAGIFIPDKLLSFMGGDAQIVELGIGYTRLFLMFAPFFMMNYIVGAFVRNDNSPTLSMIGTVMGSLSNVLFDYIFMFVFNMGLAGAALATVASPILSILICSIHFISKKNTIKFTMKLPSIDRLIKSCQLGASAFVGELSAGIITTTYNFLILGIAGNIGVAAYGVVTNYAMVANAMFNGVTQGAQPLISKYYGQNDKSSVNKLKGLGIITVMLIALLIYGVVFKNTNALVQIFNSENDMYLSKYAFDGMRLYFIGFLFAGYNIFGAGYFSATDKALNALWISVSRGIVVILLCAIILANIFGFTGVWISFAVTEAITAIITTVKIIEKKQ